MQRTKIIEELIDEKFESKRKFAEHIGMPPTTLQSILKRGIGNASVDNVIRICKGLGITVEELERRAASEAIAEQFNMSVEELANQADSNKLNQQEISFIAQAKKLSLEELVDKFTITVDGKPATYEEIQSAIAFIRSLRELKNS